MKDRAGYELEIGDRVLFLQAGTSNSWLVWGTVEGFTPKKVRVADARGVLLLREPRSVVKPVGQAHKILGG